MSMRVFSSERERQLQACRSDDTHALFGVDLPSPEDSVEAPAEAPGPWAQPVCSIELGFVRVAGPRRPGMPARL